MSTHSLFAGHQEGVSPWERSKKLKALPQIPPRRPWVSNLAKFSRITDKQDKAICINCF